VKKLFFTIDDLATRWAVPASQIGELGAEGLLQFGVYFDGMLHVEVGEYGPLPDLHFTVESSGLWSGFIPINKDTVATCWLHGGTEHIQIPNTACGKVVRVISYIPRDPDVDKEHRLLVSASDLEKFEREHEAPTNTADECAEHPSVPDKWSRGMRLIAWDVANSIVNAGGKLSGPALLAGMQTAYGVRRRGDTLVANSSDATLLHGEVEVKPSTVKRDWVSQIKRLLEHD